MLDIGWRKRIVSIWFILAIAIILCGCAAPDNQEHHFGEIITSISELPQDGSITILTQLPWGFSYRGGAINYDTRQVDLTIWSANTAISYVQAPVTVKVSSIIEGNPIPVNISEFNGTCTIEGNQHQIFWTDGKKNFYLTGSLSCEDLALMASSQAPLTNETIKLLPSTHGG